MPKDTKKKANPALEDDEVLEEEDTDTEDETSEEDETDTDTEDDADEAEDDEEVEEEPVKKPAKASKTGAKSASKTAKVDKEDDDGAGFKREAPKTRSANSVEAAMQTDIAATKAKLAKQPKVRIFIPLGIGEKKGSKSAVESVTINGYRQVLPKGEYITVPQAVADLIEQHYNMAPENTEMGEAYRLDKPRFKDGMSTDEALS